MVEDQIIKYVKKYPVLYNTTMSQYRDIATRNIAWEEISERLHIPVDDVKAKWGKLRNCYTNAMKRRRRKNDLELNALLPWKFENQMEFLLPFLGRRKNGTITDNSMIENTINDNDNDSVKEETFLYYDRPASPAPSAFESSDSNDFKSTTPNGKNSDNFTIKDFVNMKPSNERHMREGYRMDEHDYFFISMSKQLKKLPRSDQAEIKFQLHKLIYEAEKKQM